MAATMNFFKAQDEARGRTTKLLVLLLLAVLILTSSLYVMAVVLLDHGLHGQKADWFQTRLFLGTTGIALTVIVIGSLVKIAELSRGGSVIAEGLGGRLVAAGTSQPEEKRYMNVVQEMALAAGLPVPLCYVIESDLTINAFAAGNSPQDAAVGVTRGALNVLSRDELQGVIAHEFSHIGNGDMRLNLQIIGSVAGLAALTQLGYLLIHFGFKVGSSPGKDKKGWAIALAVALAIALAGLFVVLIGLLGVFFARIIQASVSRQREYLADASAVQFTRNPLGFASALRRVAANAGRDRKATAADLESRHLFFASSGGFMDFIFSTHPPIEERIRRVDPTGESIKSRMDSSIPMTDCVLERPSCLAPSAASAVSSTAVSISTARPPVIPSVSIATADAPSDFPNNLQIERALGYAGRLPEVLRETSGDPVGAMGIVLGLILPADVTLRNAQLEKAKALAGGEVVRVVSRIEVNLRALPSGARVPLLDLCVPALRQLSTQQQVAFGQSIDQAIYDADDGLIVLLIHAMMRRQLAVAVPQTTWQGDLPQACSLVLSAVVQTSSEDEVAQKRAYFLGCRALQLPGLRLAIINSAEVDLASVESALGFIFSQRMQFRRQFVHVCGIAMLSDGKVEPAEVEIVRAVAESLGVVIATA